MVPITYPVRSLSDVLDAFFGWDEITEFSSTGGYPPYDVVQDSETKIHIDVALAGFSPGEMDVSIESGKLIISGKKVSKEEVNFIRRGIARRKFQLVWNVPDNMVVNKASFENGILRVDCEIIVPDEKKPKKIPISFDSQKSIDMNK